MGTDNSEFIRTTLLETSSNISVQMALFNAALQASQNDSAIAALQEIKNLVNRGLIDAGVVDTTAGSGKVWTPPTASQMKQALLSMIGERPLVKSDGPLVVVSFNGYLLDGAKAGRAVEPLLELVRRAHVILFQETNADAMRSLSKASGYGLNVSHRNNRGQACGILFHPRLQWLGDAPKYHDYGLDIPGHPEFKQTLRPALQRRVIDVVSNFVLDFVNVHGKSNLGGPEETRPIRRLGNEMLAAELKRQGLVSPYKPRPNSDEVFRGDTAAGAGPVMPAMTAEETVRFKQARALAESKPLGAVIIGGDWNARLDSDESTEFEPLLQAGFAKLANPDKRWTYQYKDSGGQFDGFFARGLDGKVSDQWIPKFAEKKADAWFYRELSDHLPVFIEIKV